MEVAAHTNGHHEEAEEAPVVPQSRLTVPVSDIVPSRMKMLWRGRIPAATLSVIAGPPGLGKSTLTATIAAELTKKGHVVGMSNLEDDPSSVIRPRLEVADAILERVHLIPEDLPLVFPRDLEMLEEFILQTGARAFFMDPFSGHFPIERRMHDRPMLQKLIALGRRLDCAMVAIHHPTKSNSGRSAIELIGGPVSGLSGAARAVYMYGYDPDDIDRRALACVKINGVDMPPALVFEHDTIEYTVDRRMVEAGLLKIKGESNAQAKGVMSPGQRKEARDKECVEWLSKFLAAGEDCMQPTVDVKNRAREIGFSWQTVQRGCVTLKVEMKRIGGWGTHGGWYRRLPNNHPLRLEKVGDGAT